MRNKLRILASVLFACIFIEANATSPMMRRLMEMPPVERAVVIIKQYQTLHRPEHRPTNGYGHVVRPGEPYRKGVQLTERQADALLREDLRKFCALFNKYDADSLLLACLSYNCGPARVMGGKGAEKSRLLRKIESGSRNILPEYLAFCHFRGKVHKRLRQRRFVEYIVLSVK